MDPDGESYVNFGVTAGLYVGGTIGLIVDDHYRIYWYYGGGPGKVGVSASATWSPNNPTLGWNNGLQAVGFAAMQSGYSGGLNLKDLTNPKNSFIEVGVGGPFSYGTSRYKVVKTQYEVAPSRVKATTYISKKNWDKLSPAQKKKINLPKVYKPNKSMPKKR